MWQVSPSKHGHKGCTISALPSYDKWKIFTTYNMTALFSGNNFHYFPNAHDPSSGTLVSGAAATIRSLGSFV
jgi:hypothetical protein